MPKENEIGFRNRDPKSCLRRFDCTRTKEEDKLGMYKNTLWFGDIVVVSALRVNSRMEGIFCG